MEGRLWSHNWVWCSDPDNNKLSETLHLIFGIDTRTYTGFSLSRNLNDLLGAGGYLDKS
jgi:hypothetical protein